jgi:hypothetical protein
MNNKDWLEDAIRQIQSIHFRQEGHGTRIVYMAPLAEISYKRSKLKSTGIYNFLVEKNSSFCINSGYNQITPYVTKVRW